MRLMPCYIFQVTTATSELVSARNPHAPKIIQKKLPKTIGPQMVSKIMPWLETYYHERHCYPTPSEFIQRFDFSKLSSSLGISNLESVERLHMHKYFRRSLDDRGIIADPNDLSHSQRAAIAVLTNFADGRTTEAKLADLGISAEQLNGWMVNPSFQQRMTSAADASLNNFFPNAAAQLQRNVNNGDQRALEFYFKVTGREQTPETVNLKMAMQSIVEAIQEVVKEPEMINLIEARFTSILSLKKSTTPVAQPEGLPNVY